MPYAAGQGFLYVLDCKGAPREGWPIQMAEIQAQPAVADINGDGEVEIVVADVHGNVAAFNWRGREIWERHLKSLISQVLPPHSPQEDALGESDINMALSALASAV